MTSVQRSAVALLLVATFAAHAQTSADALQRAAEGNDYRAFREALDGAKEPKAVYRDIDAVWSYAQSSPTGAFFDDKSDLMSIVRKYPGYAKAMTDVGKERGWPPMTRASFDAQQGPNGALLIGSPDEVVDKILRHSAALGGISRLSFQMNVASLPNWVIPRFTATIR